MKLHTYKYTCITVILKKTDGKKKEKTACNNKIINFDSFVCKL